MNAQRVILKRGSRGIRSMRPQRGAERGANMAMSVVALMRLIIRGSSSIVVVVCLLSVGHLPHFTIAVCYHLLRYTVENDVPQDDRCIHGASNDGS
jgi:hypothetical protein